MSARWERDMHILEPSSSSSSVSLTKISHKLFPSLIGGQALIEIHAESMCKWKYELQRQQHR
jgi:hypothetical protein